MPWHPCCSLPRARRSLHRFCAVTNGGEDRDLAHPRHRVALARGAARPIAMKNDHIFERHFVAYGVRIELQVDCRTPLDLQLPFGWRAVEDDEVNAPVTVRYALINGVAGECAVIPFVCRNRPCRGRAPVGGYRPGAGSRRGAVRRRARAGPSLRTRWCCWLGTAAPSSCPAPASPVRPPSYRHGSKRARLYYSDEFAVLDRAGQSSSVRPPAGDPRQLDGVDSQRAGRGTGRRDPGRLRCPSDSSS